MTTGTPAADLDPIQALEKFIVDHDDLLQLEARVSRFNIFDALGITHAEIRHSNFLAFLLDPAESHGQGPLFFRALLMDLLKLARDTGLPVPISPIELDGIDPAGVDVRREWHNIDLLIKCDHPRFVIALENKIYASEHSNQLSRYRKTLKQHFPDSPCLLVFLTREGDQPTDDHWCPYSYNDVHRVLSRIRKTQSQSIGQDILTFLDHYLNLLESRFMNDPQIDELCQRIYKNHRQAIDLIMEYVGSPAAKLAIAMEQAIKDNGHWLVTNRTNQRVECIPLQWEQWLPPINKRARFDPHQWMFLQINIGRKGCASFIHVCPTTDLEFRKQFVMRLIQDPTEFGLSFFFKDTARIRQWTALGRIPIAAWKEDEEPNEERVIKALTQHLDKRLEQLKKIPEALQPLIAAWKPQ